MNKQIPTSLNQTRILVTGGAGFIGSHLVECLVEIGAQVTVVDNLNTGSLDNLQQVRSQLQLIIGDLSDLLRTERLRPADYAYIFHLAANPYIPPSVENPAMDFQANLANTFTLLEAMRPLTDPPRLVNVSSAAVYGNPARLPIRENDPTVPISPYGVSKLAAERYVTVYSRLYDLWTTSLRFFSVYGPRQRKQVVYDFFRKLQVNPNRLEILGDGCQARDFVYVLDAVRAMLLAATTAPGQGEVYNVASGATYTISNLAIACCETCQTNPEIVYTGQIRPGDAQRWEVDISQLAQLGYKSQISLETGLTAIWEWCNNGLDP